MSAAGTRSRFDLLLDRLEAVERASTSLITCVKLLMPDAKNPEDPRLSRYKDAKHHRAIAAALEEVEAGTVQNLIVNVPPRHGKTELASKTFIPFFVGKNPEKSVIFGTYNQTFASDIGRDVRTRMQHPAYAQVFPGVRLRDDSQASDRLQTEQGGLLAFVGRGGATTGRGGDLIVIDDPIKDRKEANSKVIRDQLWTWFTEVIMTRRMDDSARMLLIQTRWHEDDLVGRLTDPTNPYYDADEAAKWKIIDLPALALDNDPMGRKPGEPLWPERFGREHLLQQQRTNPRGFSALFQGRPAPEGGAFFLDSYLRTYKPDALPSELRIYASSDHALGMDQNRDKTCLLVVGVDRHENIYVLPDTILRHIASDQAVEEMLKIMKARKPLIWWAEKTHISKSIGPFLRKRMREEHVNCAVHEVTPIGDKQARAQSIHARAAMGKVYFPERALWWPEARDQLLKFPQAAHDDFVDALAYIGLGLSLQVGAGMSPRERNSTNGPRTFGDMIAESNRARRDERLAAETRGW